MRTPAREPGLRCEVAGDERRQLGRARRDCLRRRAALGRQAGRPARQVEQGVADHSPVPVHQQRPSRAEAEVIRPHVEVEQGVASQLRGRGRRGQLIEVELEPRRVAQAQGEHRTRVGGDVGPAQQLGAERFGAGQSRWRWRRRDLRQRRAHGRDIARAPGRRPVRVAQILDREQGAVAVVVEAEQPWQERGFDGGVDAMLVAQIAGGVVVHRPLDERRAPVVQRDDAALDQRVAAPRHQAPCDRLGAEQSCDALPVHRRSMLGPMRAAVYTGPSRPLELETLELDAPGAGEVARADARVRRLPLRPARAWTASGPSGRRWCSATRGSASVEAVGDGRARARARATRSCSPGTRPCGSCRRCAQGRPWICESQPLGRPPDARRHHPAAPGRRRGRARLPGGGLVRRARRGRPPRPRCPCPPSCRPRWAR